MGKTFGRPDPKIWDSKKGSKFSAIFDNFPLWSWISPEQLQISKNLKEMWSNAIPRSFQEKSTMNFGPQTTKFYWLTWIFRGDYISAFRGCCPLKFLHALQIDRGLLLHTRTGTGSAKNFWSWKIKIWPKIQRIRPYNFGASGSILTKHFPYDVLRGRGHNMGKTVGRPAP